ncbi:MAG: hypothetical protein M3Z15_00545 [Pseudomonadota bacterium]|nr:hypothetical protein [Pseudomonadota bacterium]
MPTDACQWFYECEACKALLRPLAGDCCVFCSYGSTGCPPMQEAASDCCRKAVREPDRPNLVSSPQRRT